MNKKITFCGNILVDSVKTITSWPEQGMLVSITGVRRSVGGCVCNTGIDLKILDPSVEVRANGKVGGDDAGDFAVTIMESKGIDCSQVRRIEGVPTTFTDVMSVEGTGDCIIGEVSKVNDDHTDNYFLETVSRFADIEEDEPVLHPLCNECGEMI